MSPAPKAQHALATGKRRRLAVGERRDDHGRQEPRQFRQLDSGIDGGARLDRRRDDRGVRDDRQLRRVCEGAHEPRLDVGRQRHQHGAARLGRRRDEMERRGAAPGDGESRRTGQGAEPGKAFRGDGLGGLDQEFGLAVGDDDQPAAAQIGDRAVDLDEGHRRIDDR